MKPRVLRALFGAWVACVCALACAIACTPGPAPLAEDAGAAPAPAPAVAPVSDAAAPSESHRSGASFAPTGVGLYYNVSSGIPSTSTLAPTAAGTFVRSDGGVWSGQAIQSSDLPTLTLTGDTTGSASGGSVPTTTGKINGATVPAAGSLTTGNVLQVSGASATTYGAVNLAGGANYVTGALPAGNQALTPGEIAYGTDAGVTTASADLAWNEYGLTMTLGSDPDGGAQTIVGQSSKSALQLQAGGGNMSVASITIDSAGNYGGTPTITFSNTGSCTGSGGAATPTMSGGGSGSITGITITNGGSYTCAPTIGTSGGSPSSTAILAPVMTTGSIKGVLGTSYTVLQLANARTDFIEFGDVVGTTTGYIRVPNPASATATPLIRSGSISIITQDSNFITFGSTTGGASFGLESAGTVLIGAGASSRLQYQTTAPNIVFGSGGLTYTPITAGTAINDAVSASSTNATAVANRSITGQNAPVLSDAGAYNGGSLTLGSGDPTDAGNLGTRGSLRLRLGTTIYEIELAEPVLGQRIVGLFGGTGGVTSTQMPASSGDGVLWFGYDTTDPTALPVSGVTLYANSGGFKATTPGGSYERIVANMTGTQNTQTGVWERYGTFGRVTTVSGTVVHNTPVATSGSTALVTARANCRQALAGDAGAAGDLFASEIRGTFRNVGGTVTQVGSTTNVLTNADSNLSASTFAFSVSGTNVVSTATLTPSAGASEGTIDCTLRSDAFTN